MDTFLTGAGTPKGALSPKGWAAVRGSPECPALSNRARVPANRLWSLPPLVPGHVT
jgi:hypothetical protein